MIYVLALAVFVGVAYVCAMLYRVKTFRNTAAPGDICVFYIDEDRCIGKIEKIDGDTFYITSFSGNIYVRNIDDIYPT
jgi:hypothetical protein